MKTPIAAIKHPADSRTNIPTEELRDFVAEDEDHPKVMALRARPQPGPATDVGRQGQSGHIAADAAHPAPFDPGLIYKYVGERYAAIRFFIVRQAVEPLFFQPFPKCLLKHSIIIKGEIGRFWANDSHDLNGGPPLERFDQAWVIA